MVHLNFSAFAWVCVLAGLSVVWKGSVLALSTTNSKGSGSGRSAIPRSKIKRTGMGKLFGQSTLQRMIRELKMSFCSELEVITLQVKNSLVVAQDLKFSLLQTVLSLSCTFQTADSTNG